MKGERLGGWWPEALGMNRKNQERGALIERTREAGSEQELEAAEKDAEGWLKVNPDDVRVIAASGWLAKTGARVQDSERGGNRLSLPVFVMALTAGALADTFTLRWRRGC
jgi:hypothetical protein